MSPLKDRLNTTYFSWYTVKGGILMMINTKAIVSASEANQNFSRVTRIADAQGQAVIFKNNKPKYLLVDIESTP